MNLLDKKHQAKLYLASVLTYFALFSFNSLATSLMAALVGVKWELVTPQEKFMIAVAVLANWTGLVLVFVQKGAARLASGKPPIETGDTEHLTKPAT